MVVTFFYSSTLPCLFVYTLLYTAAAAAEDGDHEAQPDLDDNLV